MSIVQYNFPTIIKYGNKAAKMAPLILAEKGCERPMIITDRPVSQLSFLKEIKASLEDAGLITEIYADFQGNPIRQHVMNGAEKCREYGADALVIVGGGAALDVGKAIALMLNHPGDVFDYEDGNPDSLPIDQPFPFMIAIPTTAGTGSEVGRSSVISEDQSKKKRIIFDPKMLPNIVLADPELTVGLPAAITAATGFDALTHNIEAYLAKGFHPICDGIALEGVRLIAKNLEKAVKSPLDLEARGAMLMASMMGAIAFQKGLGLTHSAAHALSTVCDTHHGLANALMIESCMKFNQPMVQEKFKILEQVVGCEKGTTFLEWLGAFKKKVGLPSGLKEIGVTITDQLIDIAFDDPCHPSGPKPVTKNDFKTIYQESL